MAGLKNCKVCHNVIAKNAKFCPHCGAKNKKNNWWVGVIIIVVLVAVINTIYKAGTDQTSNNSQTEDSRKRDSTASVTEKPITKEEFIDSCVEFVYREVERDPDAYKDKNTKIKGKVVQVVESFGTTTLRVATASNGYEDVWYVTYKPASGEKRILEDDTITVYGVCSGIKSYMGLLGNQVTVPAMKASYIDVKE